ncbi:hypothetical protein A2U01_0091679 [Trifolium medium]|uniref:Uncharacterized protein n=1 Tax=Trifolium medium TaxID=97028 RepID=A0A392UDC4_9FABA|nr:hypothetical protein [Trifolium medium]
MFSGSVAAPAMVEVK